MISLSLTLITTTDPNLLIIKLVTIVITTTDPNLQIIKLVPIVIVLRNAGYWSFSYPSLLYQKVTLIVGCRRYSIIGWLQSYCVDEASPHVFVAKQ